MSNAMKYIRNLEAVGFGRDQAEAQVQMVLDALEGDLVTKGDFAAYKSEMRNEFATLQLQVQLQIKESEFRMTTRLGAIIVGTAAIGIPLLTWLIKV